MTCLTIISYSFVECVHRRKELGLMRFTDVCFFFTVPFCWKVGVVQSSGEKTILFVGVKLSDLEVQNVPDVVFG